MKYDYSSLAATAVRLIDKFGRDTTLRTITKSGTEFDPTIVESDETISAAFISYKVGQVDGTLIQSNDKMILTYSLIDNKNEIIDRGNKYEVVRASEVEPGITPMIYKVQIRS